MQRLKLKPDLYDQTSAFRFVYGRDPKPKRRKQKRRNRRPKSKTKYTANYIAHLHSEAWKSFKMAIIAYRGLKCERCGKSGRVELHHKHYRTLGHEAPGDVMLLCNPCHIWADSRRRHNKPQS